MKILNLSIMLGAFALSTINASEKEDPSKFNKNKKTNISDLSKDSMANIFSYLRLDGKLKFRAQNKESNEGFFEESKRRNSTTVFNIPIEEKNDFNKFKESSFIKRISGRVKIKINTIKHQKFIEEQSKDIKIIDTLLSKIEYIDLSFTFERPLSLHELLKYTVSLKDLNLSHHSLAYMNENEAKKISEYTAKLKKLNLSNTDIQEKYITYFINSNQLEYLNLESVNLEYIDGYKLGKLLKNLKKLNLDSTKMTQESIINIIKHTTLFEELILIWLNLKNLEDKSLDDFIESVKNMKNLKTLDLRWTEIPEKSMIKIKKNIVNVEVLG